MNILKTIQFHPEKPFVLPVRQTEKINIMAVGLGEEQVLSKHSTSKPTLLMVLTGAIIFHINGEQIHLETGDTYNIPVNVEHEVVGTASKNVFTLTQEL